jgi:hypothetical protein
MTQSNMVQLSKHINSQNVVLYHTIWGGGDLKN